MGSLSSQLVLREIATMKQVEDALARQVLYGGDLVTNLLEVTGPDKEAAITYVLAEHLAMPPGPAGELPALSQELRDKIPQDLATRHGFLPLALGPDALRVAVSQALSDEALREIEFVAEVAVVQVAAPSARVQQAHARDYSEPLDRRTARLLAKLGGRPDPSPSTRPPPNEVPRFPRAFSPQTTSLRSDMPPPMPAAEPQRRVEPGGRSSLVRWARGVHTGERARPRRRRGPFTIADAEETLFSAEAPETVLEGLFDFARQYFVYTALFVVHRDLAEGRDAHGPGAERREVLGIGVPLGQRSILARACQSASPVCQALEADGIDQELRKDLHRPAGVVPVVVPIVVRDRAVVLLYGDDGEEPLFLGEVSEVLAMSALAGGALERIARAKRKAKKRAEPAIAPHEQLPRAPGETRAAKEGSLVTALAALAEEPREAEPASADSGPVVETGEADASEDELLRATLDQIDLPSQMSEIPSDLEADDEEPGSRASYHPPATLPPTTDPTRAKAVLPSVIVEVGAAETRAVDALLAPGADETDAMGEVLRLGQTIVPALLAKLPGPLSVDLDALVRGACRPSHGGVLFRALAALRRIALHYVTVQAANMDVSTRVVACLALAEFAYPESANALVQRLFDPDPRVRAAAATSARWLRSSPETFTSMTTQLSRIVTATMERISRRSTAAAALGEIGAKDAIGALLSLGEAKDEGLRKAGLDALADITFETRDFDGYRKWWKKHGNEDPALWAIEALSSPDVERVRRAARELAVLGIEADVDPTSAAAREDLAERARAALRRARESSVRP